MRHLVRRGVAVFWFMSISGLLRCAPVDVRPSVRPGEELTTGPDNPYSYTPRAQSVVAVPYETAPPHRAKASASNSAVANPPHP